MTDELPETSPVGRGYCPGCEPDADPITEVLNLAPCYQHQREAPTGLDDEQVPPSTEPVLGVGDADGKDCRHFAELLRRARR